MAKYLIDSTDIEIEEVAGTENLKFNFANGNNLETQLNNLSNYSTTETVVGKWIDNKPIYRKVINSYGTTGDNVAIPHNIVHFKQLINYSLIAGDSGLSYVSNNNLYDLWINTVDTNNVNMKIAGAYNNWQIYIILEYIKTTD